MQIAVHHPDQVVQPFPRRQGQRAQRLRFVRLAVPDETPDLGLLPGEKSPGGQVAVKARLVNRDDRTQPHRYGRELPEIRHQVRVRIGGKSAALGQFLAEMLQLQLGQASLHKGPRVDSRNRMSLKEDHVRRATALAAAEEVVEPDLIQGGAGGVGRDMTADAADLSVGVNHHGHGVPADGALDLMLHLPVAGELGLAIGRNGVDVGRADRGRQTQAPGVQPRHQPVPGHCRPIGPLLPRHLVRQKSQRFQPLLTRRHRRGLVLCLRFAFHSCTPQLTVSCWPTPPRPTASRILG